MSQNEIFDFGFTAVDESELPSSQKLETKAKTSESRLDQMYKAITPLLENLKANPEKEYILWPNRVEIVEQFQEKLEDIYKG